MPTLISETRSAFVHKRKILDGAFIANEAIWWFKKKKINASLLKLDFQKAYDSIKWSFVGKVLEDMGFADKWRGWINHYISLALVSILINGSPITSFKMERGLR